MIKRFIKTAQRSFGVDSTLLCHCERPTGASQSHDCCDEGSPLTPTLSYTSLRIQAHKTRPSSVRFASRRARGKRVAFTLAEVLITLAIIGVVAAMTIPTLISNYKEKETVTKVKKIYSNLSNAHKMIEAMNGYGAISGAYDETKTPAENTQAIVNLYKPYFKISKDCGFEPGCLTSGPVKSLSGVDYADYDNTTNEYKMILSDGTALWFYVAYEDIYDEDGNYIHSQVSMNIKVDINGFDGPYQWGRDLFVFENTDNSIVPYGTPKSTQYFTFDEYCKIKTGDAATRDDGLGCTAWVIQNGNMDYLHCDDLSWTGKHKCSD